MLAQLSPKHALFFFAGPLVTRVMQVMIIEIQVVKVVVVVMKQSETQNMVGQ